MSVKVENCLCVKQTIVNLERSNCLDDVFKADWLSKARTRIFQRRIFKNADQATDRSTNRWWWWWLLLLLSEQWDKDATVIMLLADPPFDGCRKRHRDTIYTGRPTHGEDEPRWLRYYKIEIYLVQSSVHLRHRRLRTWSWSITTFRLFRPSTWHPDDRSPYQPASRLGWNPTVNW